MDGQGVGGTIGANVVASHVPGGSAIPKGKRADLCFKLADAACQTFWEVCIVHQGEIGDRHIETMATISSLDDMQGNMGEVMIETGGCLDQIFSQPGK